jgi:putative ubiquitin-RnfH superfamily antitoxin RatB of RatAB toxin-antitoxin module
VRVQVVLALPREHRAVTVELPEGATVRDAVAASGLPLTGIDGQAVFGVRADADATLREGDRVELLRPLMLDPKEARRRRAARSRGG